MEDDRLMEGLKGSDLVPQDLTQLVESLERLVIAPQPRDFCTQELASLSSKLEV